MSEVASISSVSRAFGIETVAWGAHQLACVSIESESHFLELRDPLMHPPDWQERVAEQVQDADMVFMAYFPPEIALNTQNVPILGRQVRRHAEEHHSVYRQATDMAAEMGKRVAVADIANRLRYFIYELRSSSHYVIASQEGPVELEVDVDHEKPSATDARRLFTARAIRQMAGAYPDGASLLYIAAPAHARRVASYVPREPTEQEATKFKRYQRAYRRLDRKTRVYDHTTGKWTLVDAIDIT